jgi:hypothetical protein
MVDTNATMCTSSKTIFCSQFFQSPCDAKDMEEAIVRKAHFISQKDCLYTKDNGLSGYRRTWRTLRVFSLMLKLCSHELYGILDAGRATSSVSMSGAYAIGSKETSGSRLRKHSSTCSATASARAGPGLQSADNDLL